MRELEELIMQLTIQTEKYLAILNQNTFLYNLLLDINFSRFILSSYNVKK